jgi:hypothetical protein
MEKPAKVRGNSRGRWKTYTQNHTGQGSRASAAKKAGLMRRLERPVRQTLSPPKPEAKHKVPFTPAGRAVLPELHERGGIFRLFAHPMTRRPLIRCRYRP